jgi:ERF superfamily
MTPQSAHRDSTIKEEVQPVRDSNLLMTTDATGAEKSVRTLPATGLGLITKAIATVMQEIDTVAKRGQNAFHKYRYARMEDILRRLTPLLGKHGLVVFQDEVGRSMFDDDGVIAVMYEFTVAHESGEVWPQRLRQTGVSRCRDSKGGWDDKSVNKCHTAARKYFLLSLFQIPTGEEPDADQDADDTAHPEEPQVVRVDKGGAKAWTTQFLARIRQAPTLAAVDQWVQENQISLDRLAQVAPEQHKVAEAALLRRRSELMPKSKTLPPLVGQRVGPLKSAR